MNGERVGTWSRERGTDALSYETSWLSSPHARPLSLSLPFTATRRVAGAEVTHFFDNLLPDSRAIRERIGRRFGAAPDDGFALLSAIGRDCVGAVQLLPPDADPGDVRTLNCERLREVDVERLLRGAAGASPFAGAEPEEDDILRLSLAGAQEKTALLRVSGHWCRPHGSTPTTHLLKLPLGMVGGLRGIDLRDSVENEWLCMTLLAAMGLPAAAVEIVRFGEHKTLCVERFDRAWMEGRRWIARLPQEDFCQATGTPPARKYQKDGGPGLSRCLALLAGSEAPSLDRTRFLLAQLAFWMLGAIDGHAKNFSVFLRAGGTYALTPLYDVLSVYPVLGRGKGRLPRQKAHLAMSVRGKSPHSQLDDVEPRHWLDEARRAGMPQLAGTMREMASAVPSAVSHVEARLPAGFPERVWAPVVSGLRQAADGFLAGTEVDRAPARR